MVSQSSLDRAYMDCAFAIAKMSRAQRKQVGAILVAPKGGIIAEGINGTPSGFDNCCELYHEIKHELVYRPDYGTYYCVECSKPQYVDMTDNNKKYHNCKSELVTKPEVLHAESNAIAKVAKSTNSSEGATMYVTMSPCFDCSKMMIQAGIKRVVYAEEYRITDGIDLLRKAKIQVDKLP